MERIYRKLTDVRCKPLRPHFKNDLATEVSLSYRKLDTVKKNKIKRQDSLRTQKTYEESTEISNNLNTKSPSVGYGSVIDSEPEFCYTSMQNSRNRSIMNLKPDNNNLNNKNWATSFHNDETKYKVASNSSFRANLRKNSSGTATRRKLLTKNNYYNDRILKTLLRSQSNTNSNKVSASKPNYASSRVQISKQLNSGVKYYSKEKFVTHHNMPIQSKITKGIKTKSKLGGSPPVSILSSAQKIPGRSKINPTASFTNSERNFDKQ